MFNFFFLLRKCWPRGKEKGIFKLVTSTSWGVVFNWLCYPLAFYDMWIWYGKKKKDSNIGVQNCQTPTMQPPKKATLIHTYLYQFDEVTSFSSYGWAQLFLNVKPIAVSH